MTQMANNRFVEIGRLGKPRGLEGVLRFIPGSNFTDDFFEENDLFFIKNERSDLTPIRIENIHVEKKRNQQTFFVKFDTITSRSDAEAARDRSLFVKTDQPEIKTDSSEEISLVGYAVYFRNKEIGRVLDVLKNPAHPIVEIKLGTGSLLIPFVDEFIDKTDHENDTLFCKNLDQLTDL